MTVRGLKYFIIISIRRLSAGSRHISCCGAIYPISARHKKAAITYSIAAFCLWILVVIVNTRGQAQYLRATPQPSFPLMQEKQLVFDLVTPLTLVVLPRSQPVVEVVQRQFRRLTGIDHGAIR